MLVHAQPQQLRPTRNILPLHRPRERLILHLLLHARHLDITNRLRRLHQRTSRQKSRQFIAGKQRLLQMRLPRHARIVRMRQNRLQHTLRPTLAPANAAHQQTDAPPASDAAHSPCHAAAPRSHTAPQTPRPPLHSTPTAPPPCTPYASVQTETAIPCFRRLSPFVHSCSNAKACARPNLSLIQSSCLQSNCPTPNPKPCLYKLPTWFPLRFF